MSVTIQNLASTELPLVIGISSPGGGLFAFFLLLIGIPLWAFPVRSPIKLWKAHPVAVTIVLLCAFDIALWGATRVMLGGVAQNGKIEDGRYYLGDRGFTEVSRGVYLFSRYLTFSTFPAVVLLVAARFQITRNTNDTTERSA